MYVRSEEIDRLALRQGDLLTEVQILGALGLNSIQLIVSSVGANAVGWSVPVAPKLAPAMVLSHCCEIDPCNDVKVTSVILAPLRDVHKATSPDKVRKLIESNLLSEADDTKATFLKYFYVAPSLELGFNEGAVVDFSKCFSVRNKTYRHLLEKKVLQLTDPVRESMSLKLALYFHRAQAANTATVENR